MGMAIHKRNGWRDGARAGRLSHRAEVGAGGGETGFEHA